MKRVENNENRLVVAIEDIKMILDNLLRAVSPPVDEEDTEEQDVFVQPWKWEERFEYHMKMDSGAAAAILSYYLEEEVGSYCTIFCPLNYEPYKKCGVAMAEDPDAFNAAKRSGLLAEGIHQYLEAALSNADCWHGMHDGVMYMIHNDVLCEFMPYRHRFIAEKLLHLNGDDEDAWDAVYDLAANQLRNEMYGY